jgi:hypothetical protein
MPDRFDPDMPDPSNAEDPEAKRIGYAVARIADHAERELFLLARAAHAPDDDAVRRLEYEAGTAHRDSVALTEEHGLER